MTTGSSTAAGRSTIPAGDARATSRATSPARRSSTSSATSPRRRAPAGGIRCRPPRDFARAAGAAGIGAGVFVVAYGTLGGAERLWWLLRHFGHDDCAVIDLDAWRGPLAAGEEQAEPRAFEPRERAGDTIELDELAARHRELVVVDARLAPRCRGEANPVDRVPGRIPGAVNAPWNEPLPELPPGELVAYCGSGVTACVTLHRLHLAGRDGPPLPRLVVRVGAAPGAPARARLSAQAAAARSPPSTRAR